MTKFGLCLAVIGCCSTLTLSAPATCPAVCTADYTPICGNDGETYSNACTFGCARTRDSKLEKRSDGECPKETTVPEDSCACTKELNPVCGNDYNTYNNPCLLNCEKKKNKRLEKSYDGECSDGSESPEESPRVCVCTFDYTPVCGSDGKTYSNLCALECAQKDNRNLVKAAEGECAPQTPPPATCVCTFIFLPVCGSDGKTYPNECSLNCAKKDNRNLVKAAEGECAPQTPPPATCVCTLIFLPVCGSDGKTYPNECSLNCAKKDKSNLVKASNGACGSTPPPPATCVCTFIFLPVCGSDGKTYPNECSLNCAKKDNRNLVKASNGACGTTPPPPASCACPRNYRPVCGSDGKTYSNECTLNCAKNNNRNLVKVSDGVCEAKNPPPANCVCTLNYQPVCGSDGKTYSNECALNCAKRNNRNLVKAGNGVCGSNTPPPASCACPRNYRPVCGSDGKTYSNECTLNCAKNDNRNLVKAADGVCEPQTPPPATCICTFIYKPVCGSDGKTYSNECSLNCAKKNNRNLVKAGEGVCPTQPQPTNCACTRELRPVCGSNGVTYNNKCLLQCAAKQNSAIKIVSEGSCNDVPPTNCACTRELRPLCGSNGVTYNNKCLWQCAAKQNSAIKIVSEGACKNTNNDEVQVVDNVPVDNSQVEVVDNVPTDNDQIQVVDNVDSDQVQVVNDVDQVQVVNDVDQV